MLDSPILYSSAGTPRTILHLLDGPEHSPRNTEASIRSLPSSHVPETSTDSLPTFHIPLWMQTPKENCMHVSHDQLGGTQKDGISYYLVRLLFETYGSL